MNPTEFKMMWMSQYNPERISLEDAASYFGHPSVGLSVMDDIQQQPIMDLNPMMSIVGGDFSGQAAAAAAAALGVQPGTLTLSANANNIYGLTPVNALQQQLLQQSAAVFQNYNEVMGGGLIQTSADGSVDNTGNGLVDDDDGGTHGGLLTSDDVQQQQQVYEQIEDAGYDDGSGGGGISGLIPKQEIINIDDFVMMTDSNSYDDNDFITTAGEQDLTQTVGVNIAATGLVDDNDILVPLNEQQKFLVDNYHQSQAQTNLNGAVVGSAAAGGAASSATHRNQRKTRKIEPVNRPGLVLKTPIAYKGNIDPSVIPIQKDGMAVCERCGAIGVKHTFYTKSRRFCSMACARGELYSLVVNNKISASNQQQQQQQAAAQQQQQAQDLIDAADQQQQQQIMQQETATLSNGNDVEQVLRGTHIKTSNYRFRITDQSKITQIGGYNETLNSLANSYNNNNDGGGDLIDHNELDNGDDDQLSNSTTQQQHQQQKALRMYRDVLPQDGLPQIPKYERLPAPCPQLEKITSIRRRHYDHQHSFDWTPRLKKGNCYAAAVTSFPHAPGYEVWDNLGIDMKVEVENTDCDSQEYGHHAMQQGQTPQIFWVATILSISGYKALMRYEGFDDGSHDFWVNLCNAEVHAVGWCATRGKPLIPPKTIANKYKDWKDFLVERLSGARTLPSSFYNKINDSLQSRFRLGLNLECVDKDRISQVRLATVTKIVGKRLFLRYFDSDDGFWCHEDSPIIHPVGWATTVGHNLAAPQDYLERMLAGREAMIEVHEDDATIELFKMNFTFEEYYMEGKTNGFVEGMKLEAVDPLNLSSICAATVMAVLKFGYMMIRIDSYQPDAAGSDWFCYHEKSPCIFPVGFCQSNNITLTPPNDYDSSNFTWEQYLQDTGSVAAGIHLFHRVVPDHGFEVGMSLECADLMDPRLVCVATIARVVGRLLKIHFDGWTDEYDQWLDCESPDIYPVGWCYLVNHKLEGPPVAAPVQTPKVASKPKVQKRRKKKQTATAATSSNLVPSIVATGAKNVKPRTIALKTNPHLPKLSIKLELKPEHHNSSFYEDNQDIEDGEDGDDNDDEDDDEGGGDMMAYDEDTTSTSNSQRSEQTITPIPTNEQHTMLISSPNTANPATGLKMTINKRSATAVAAPSPTPVVARKVTKYIGTTAVASSNSNSKYIPRLLETNSNNMDSEQLLLQQQQQQQQLANASNDLIQPETWSVQEVAQFLRVNDCQAHCDNFIRMKIDGHRLMLLTKDEIINLLGMKVGPALKIFDLIQQLKCKINPGKARMNKNNKSGYL